MDKIPYFEAQRSRWSAGEKQVVSLQENCCFNGVRLLFQRLYSNRSWHCLDWLSEGTEALIGVAFQVDMWGIKVLETEIATALNHGILLPGYKEAICKFLQTKEAPTFLSQFAITTTPVALTMSEAQIHGMLVSAASSANEKVWFAAECILKSWSLFGQDRLPALLAAVKKRDLLRNAKAERVEVPARTGNRTYTNWSFVKELKSASGFCWLCKLLYEHVEADPEAFDQVWPILIKSSELFTVCGWHEKCSLTDDTKQVINNQLVKLLEIIAALLPKLGVYLDFREGPSVTSFIHDHAGIMPISVITALSEGSQSAFVSSMDSAVLLSWASADRLKALASAARQVASKQLAENIGELSDDVVDFVVSELS